MSAVCEKIPSLWSQFLMLSFVSRVVMQDLFLSPLHMATHTETSACKTYLHTTVPWTKAMNEGLVVCEVAAWHLGELAIHHLG